MAGSFYKITRKPQPVALIETRVGVASRRGSFFPPQLLKRLLLNTSQRQSLTDLLSDTDNPRRCALRLSSTLENALLPGKLHVYDILEAARLEIRQQPRSSGKPDLPFESEGWSRTLTASTAISGGHQAACGSDCTIHALMFSNFVTGAGARWKPFDVLHSRSIALCFSDDQTR